MSVFRNLKFGTKLFLGFGVVLALMTALSVIVYSNIKHLIHSVHMVEHTYEEIRLAEGVQAAMINMETGQRGFMITGKDDYLEPYYSGIESIQLLIARGQELTSDNPAQGKRWQKILQLKERWIDSVALPEIAARRQVSEGALAQANFNEISSRTTGKKIFDSIRSTLAALERGFGGNVGSINLVNLITLDLVNMETGQRGFLLTGKDESLEPFQTGQVSFQRHLSDLKAQASSSVSIQADIARLKNQVDAWITQAAEP